MNKFDTTLVPAEPQQRLRRERVVNANNDDSKIEIALIILAVLFLCSIVLGVAGGRLAGLGYAWQAVLSVIPMIPLAIWAIPFITGHAPAFFEVWQGEKSERKWADVENNRIDAYEAVLLAEYGVKKKQIDLEIAQIESDQTAQRLHVRLADIERRLLVDGIDAGPNRTDNYVANHPQPAMVAVRDFVASCYDASGFNSEMLYDNGGMRNAAPWNSIWKNESWCGDAEDIMRRYVLDDTPNQPRFRHATNADAQKAILL